MRRPRAARVFAAAALVVFSRDIPGATASPSTLISCDFDSDECSFTNGGNELAWTYASGSTPSSYTGPTTDYSGSGCVLLLLSPSYRRAEHSVGQLTDQPKRSLPPVPNSNANNQCCGASYVPEHTRFIRYARPY